MPSIQKDSFPCIRRRCGSSTTALVDTERTVPGKAVHKACSEARALRIEASASVLRRGVPVNVKRAVKMRNVRPTSARSFRGEDIDILAIKFL